MPKNKHRRFSIVELPEGNSRAERVAAKVHNQIQNCLDEKSENLKGNR
jgi:hypothetical protein